MAVPTRDRSSAPLLHRWAQAAHCTVPKLPFLPMYNRFLNEVMGIDAVALGNLVVPHRSGLPRCAAGDAGNDRFDLSAYVRRRRPGRDDPLAALSVAYSAEADAAPSIGESERTRQRFMRCPRAASLTIFSSVSFR